MAESARANESLVGKNISAGEHLLVLLGRCIVKAKGFAARSIREPD